MFVAGVAAEEGGVEQVGEVQVEHGEVEVAAGGGALIRIRSHVQTRGAECSARIPPPTAHVNLVAVVHEESRWRNVGLAIAFSEACAGQDGGQRGIHFGDELSRIRHVVWRVQDQIAGGRLGLPEDIDVAGLIEISEIALVVGGTTEVGACGDGGAIITDFRHETIRKASLERSVQCVGGHR